MLKEHELGMLVGTPAITAVQIMKDAGHPVRVSKINGYPQVITGDLKPDRLTISIVDGLVGEIERE